MQRRIGTGRAKALQPQVTRQLTDQRGAIGGTAQQQWLTAGFGQATCGFDGNPALARKATAQPQLDVRQRMRGIGARQDPQGPGAIEAGATLATSRALPLQDAQQQRSTALWTQGRDGLI